MMRGVFPSEAERGSEGEGDRPQKYRPAARRRTTQDAALVAVSWQRWSIFPRYGTTKDTSREMLRM